MSFKDLVEDRKNPEGGLIIHVNNWGEGTFFKVKCQLLLLSLIQVWDNSSIFQGRVGQEEGQMFNIMLPKPTFP